MPRDEPGRTASEIGRSMRLREQARQRRYQKIERRREQYQVLKQKLTRQRGNGRETAGSRLSYARRRDGEFFEGEPQAWCSARHGSRKMADLETHLKATLLIRSAKGLELTPAGRSYAASAKAILEQVVEAERTAAGEYAEPKGDLVVTAPVMFGRLHVLPVVTRFLASYPEVSVGLILTDRVPHFLDDQVDVALRAGDLPDSNMVAVRLGSIRHVVCGSPDYLDMRGEPTQPEDLALHSVIFFESISAPVQWSFWSEGAEIKTSIRPRLSVNTIDAAIDAGLSGTGLVRAMSYQVVEYVRQRRLRVVLPKFEPEPRPLHLVYDRQRRLPLKLRTFVDFVVPLLRERVTEANL